jgi:nucleoside-diphosphate-sugar epimerase
MAERILVTGGGGFLGQALIRQLLERGHSVQTLNRSRYPELERLGVRCFQGDLADYPAVRAAAEGVSLVFHVGAKAGVWGPYDDYVRANVVGTENVLRACRELGIKRLVYTSSPSVTFHGGDQEGIDESTPYPATFLAPYPATKAQAEQAVLAANGPDLATVALRPHLIWGPGDQHIVPRILDRARKGRLGLIGPPGKKVDAVYIDNAALAHICAMQRLSINSRIAGKAYYITNGEPWPTEDIINGFLNAAHLPPVTRRLSLLVAYRLAALLEWVFTFFRIKQEPPLTRFAVLQLGTSHWYETRAAREELGYIPRISMREGLKVLEQSLTESKR